MASLPRQLPSVPSCAARRGLLALALSAGWAVPALALDGSLGFRQSAQEGGRGAADYSLQVISRDASAQQFLGLWPGASLRIEAFVRDDATQSRVGSANSAWSQLSQHAGAALRYGHRGLRLELSASGRRRDQTPDPGLRTRQDLGQLGAWAQWRAHRRLRLSGSLLSSRAWREEAAQAEVETREQLQAAGLDLQLTPGTWRYNFSRQRSEQLARGSDATHSSHQLAFAGDLGLLGDRGRLSLSARSRRFTQELAQRELQGELLLEPVLAGVRVDPTPELDDPLEAPLVAVVELIDLDRRTPTAVDLGDEAEPGLQFGGDYRNLVLDLGAPAAVSRLRVYVEARPVAPELMQWSVYLADDAEGKVWTRQEAASASARYREWDEDLQGWEFGLAAPLTARYLKLVNVKLGPVAPQLRVTELEAATSALLPGGKDRETSLSHRLETGLELRLGPSWRTRLDLGLRLRDHAGERADQEEWIQGWGLYWTRGAWAAVGRLEWRQLDSGGLRQSDIAARSVMLRRRLGGIHALGLRGEETRDRGLGSDRRSRSLSLSAEWQLAPALRLDQRLSHSWLRDAGADLRTRALTAATTLHSVPFNWLFLDLGRVDRWSEREAGLGYTRFNDTEITVGWLPVPLISLRSHFVYQDRGEGEWFIQHSLTWTPAPGGDLALRLQANEFSDTRVDTRETGAGAALTWTPRPRLLLEGGVDTQRMHRPEGNSRPVNSYFKTSFAF